MKNILIPVFILILCILITNLNYSANRITKEYELKDFNKVDVSNGMLLNITQSSSYSIQVNAEEADFAYLKVEKRGNTLQIYIDRNNYRKNGDIKIDIKIPSLIGLDLSGGSQGMVTMDVKDDFKCNLSGGAEVGGNLSCEDLSMGISGGSIVSIKGKGTNFNAGASGGSIFNLKDFNVKNVDAVLSGGSRLEIKMNGNLNVDASGGSRVIYYGTAKVGNTDFSGGSGISRGD